MSDNSTYTGTRPRLTYKKKQIWCKGSRRRYNHLFQILSKSVKRFLGCEGPKMGVFHRLTTTGQHCRDACDNDTLYYAVTATFDL